ncbi:DsbA family protein [Thetidibacter halocola]|uniref:DsbA family protein n=1 Tax=Thetidibacter halocola TaxID=2827239 RepID=A0A8J7WA41_9RHOB|nr:DsbA family protein [Thetidibacter halocola]MBS0122729.1 DsbA family protein [Thetidibacter halocola]
MPFKTPIHALRGAAAALALMTACGAASAQDLDLSAMTPEQKDAFGAQVREYLLANPQVIMEAVAVLEQREQAQQAEADVSLVQAHMDALVNDGFSWVGGNPEGDVTIVEFMDYRCGYCRKAHPEVEQLIASDGDIRLIVKEFPILGEASVVASRFAIATQIVAGDDAYKAVHDALITMEGNPGNGPLRRMAETLGLDADAIMAEMDSDEVTRRIAETRALAQSMQISGTPSFVFGDQMVRGYAPLDIMQQIVADVRAGG